MQMRLIQFIPYILGLVGSVTMAGLVVLWNHLTGWDVDSLIIWYVVPAGAILIAGLGSAFYVLVLKLLKLRLSKCSVLLAAVFGLVTFFSFHYISYRTIYSATHELLSDSIGFGQYIDIVSSSYIYKVGPGATTANFELSELSSRAVFFIQILGALLGGLLPFGWMRQFKYCEQCKRYLKNRVIKKVDALSFDESLRTLKENMADVNLLRESIEKMKEKQKSEDYFSIKLRYCPQCYEGELLINYYMIGFFGIPQDDSDRYERIEINQSVIEEL